MPENEQPINNSPGDFRRLIGLETRERRDGYAVMELVIGPEHRNSQGFLHGGILATMIDHSGGIAGCYVPDGPSRKAVTISLTTSFLAAAASGTITAVSRKRPGGKRIFVSTTEVTDDAGRLLAVGEATYRHIG